MLLKEIRFKKKSGVITRQGPYRPSRTLKHDLIHTRLDVEFDWLRQHVHGTAVISMQAAFLSSEYD